MSAFASCDDVGFYFFFCFFSPPVRIVVPAVSLSSVPAGGFFLEKKRGAEGMGIEEDDGRAMMFAVVVMIEVVVSAVMLNGFMKGKRETDRSIYLSPRDLLFLTRAAWNFYNFAKKRD